MVNCLLLNSAIAYGSSVINKFLNPLTVSGIHLHLRIWLTNFADSTYIFRDPLAVAESRTTSKFVCCGISNKLNVPTKFALQVYIRGFHVNFVSRIHVHIATVLNFCLWNPGTCRHKIVRLSSAQFGLVMGGRLLLSGI